MIDRHAVVDRYELIERAGEGGFGEVFRALDRRTGTQVAIKILGAARPDEGSRARFAREVSLLSSLHHPNIVGYLDAGTTRSGAPFLAMEWLEGETLADRLARAPLTLGESVRVLTGAAKALAEAHRHGIVHRDIKPTNLWLRDRDVDRLVLLDFGIARQAESAVTRTGQIVGTPGYIPPEQAWGHGGSEIGPDGDVFALGCVAFECITGTTAYPKDHPARMLAKVLFEDPPALSSLRNEVPPALERVVARMLERERTARPENGRALLALLDALPVAIDGPAPQMTSPQARTLEGPELRLVSLVYVRLPADRPDTTALVRAELDRHTSCVEAAPLGCVAAFIHDSTSAVDRALHAAEVARLVRARVPDATLSLVTGRAFADGPASGELRDRAESLVSGGTYAGVVLDDTTHSLLDGRVATATSDATHVLPDSEGTLDESRRLLGKPTPCVGREEELGTLERAFDAVREDSAARLFLVVGDAGIGKSRLRHELVRRLAGKHESLRVLAARGEPMRAVQPYAVLADAFAALLGPDRRPSQATILAALAPLVPERERERIADFLAEMFGSSVEEKPHVVAARRDPRMMRRNIVAAGVSVLRGASAIAPLVFTLDDLHWADSPSLDLVEEAARELSDRPILFVGFARPEVMRERPALWRGSATEVPLRPLAQKACDALVREILGTTASAEQRAMLVQRAGGNALFLEELIRAAHDGRTGTIPDAITAMLQARLGRLDARQRRVARAASVFGETFVPSGVRAILDVEESDLAASLDALAKEEVIVPRRSERLWGEMPYRFRHALMRDAAHDLLPPTEARAAHRSAAAFCESRGAPAATVAEHLLAAGEDASAIPWVVTAAERAYFREDLSAVEKLGERALAAGATGAERGTLLAIEAQLRLWRWDWRIARDRAAEAMSLLTPNTTWWARAAHTLVHIAAYTHERELAVSLASTFLSGGIEDSEAEYGEMAAHFASAMAQIGEMKLARGLIARAQEVARTAKLEDHALAFVSLLSCTVERHGHDDLAGQIEKSRLACTILERMGADPLVRAVTEDVCGEVLCRAGQIDAGEAVLAQALALAQGERRAYAISHARLSSAHGAIVAEEERGNAHAIELAQAVLETKGITDGFEAMALHIRGVVRGARGDRAAAATDIDRAIALSDHTPVRKMHMLASRARVAESNEEALRFVRLGLDELARLGEGGWAEIPLFDAGIPVLLATKDETLVAEARRHLAYAKARLDRQAAAFDTVAERTLFWNVPQHRRILTLAEGQS